MSMSKGSIARIIAAGILAIIVGVGIAGLVWIRPLHTQPTTQMYENKNLGISFSYPGSYFIVENGSATSSQNTGAQLIALIKDTPENREAAKKTPLNISETHGAITIEVFPGKEELEIEEWVKANPDASHLALSNQSFQSAVVGGKKIISYNLSGDLTGNIIALVHNGNVFLLSAIYFSDAGTFQHDFVSILSTLQLI